MPSATSVRRPSELLRQNVEAAEREPGRPTPAYRIESQAWLARTLSELGAFAEGRRHGEEALRLATLEDRRHTSIIAHACLGFLFLAHGDLEHAIRMFDQGLALCRASGERTNLRSILWGAWAMPLHSMGALPRGWHCWKRRLV
jgi:hypothetical protein